MIPPTLLEHHYAASYFHAKNRVSFTPKPRQNIFWVDDWCGFLTTNGHCFLGDGFNFLNTLQGTNISHLGNRKIIFKMPVLGDMLVPWRVSIHYYWFLLTSLTLQKWFNVWTRTKMCSTWVADKRTTSFMEVFSTFFFPFGILWGKQTKIIFLRFMILGEIPPVKNTKRVFFGFENTSWSF